MGDFYFNTQKITSIELSDTSPDVLEVTLEDGSKKSIGKSLITIKTSPNMPIPPGLRGVMSYEIDKLVDRMRKERLAASSPAVPSPANSNMPCPVNNYGCGRWVKSEMNWGDQPVWMTHKKANEYEKKGGKRSRRKMPRRKMPRRKMSKNKRATKRHTKHNKRK